MQDSVEYVKIIYKNSWRNAMTEVNLSYDYIATFFLFMLLVWYFFEKKVPLRSYRYFAYVLVTAFGATALEVVTYKLAELGNNISYQLVYTMLSVQMLFIHSFFTCLTNYLLSIADIDIYRNRKVRCFFIVSWIIIVVVCGLNPILKWAANLVDNVYSIKGVGVLLYVIDAIMVFLMGWVLIIKRQNFKFLRKTIVVFMFVCAVVAGVAQEINAAPMLNLAITVFCLVLYLFGQGPEVDIDRLTGQFSRRFFGTYIKDKYISNDRFSLIVLNLDDFKFINQSYGVATGDLLLQQVGVYLEENYSSYIVFHYGADQFCIVVDKDTSAVNDIACDIFRRFNDPWVLDKIDVSLSATICVIACPDDADNPETLIEIIDYTMETAKNINKGKIIFAADVDLEKSHMYKKVERAIKDAIASRSVMVYYQPIYSVEKKHFNSAEALARLYDNELGFVPPDIFITTAEKTGHIIELGELILHKVCEFIKANQLSKTDIEYIEINVSPLQLMQKGFADKLLDIMKQYDVDASQINIEITETAMMSSFSVVNENLEKIIENNISISLDDYGSGYANINYINTMPFKFIKVDRDIVQSSFAEYKAHITLEHTIKMLTALELQIIAEGVETEEMRDELINFGCQYLQGWYYSKALPEKEFMDFINS